jgi:hypothetical protein
MAQETYKSERRAILQEYDSWARKNRHAAKADPIEFFSYLRSERPDLLDFNPSGVEKWQLIHGWLKSYGRIKK